MFTWSIDNFSFLSRKKNPKKILAKSLRFCTISTRASFKERSLQGCESAVAIYATLEVQKVDIDTFCTPTT